MFWNAILQESNRPVNLFSQSDELKILLAGFPKFSDLTLPLNRFLTNQDTKILALNVLKQSFTAVFGERHPADAQVACYESWLSYGGFVLLLASS
jgi:hypothetical protein